MNDTLSNRLTAGIASLGATLMMVAATSTSASAQQAWPPAPAPAGMQEVGPGWPPAAVNVTRPLPGKGFKEGFVDINGFHIRFVDSGGGTKGQPPIVDFPGSGGLEFSTAKDILAKEYRVVELNPPGFGPDAAVAIRQDSKDIAMEFLQVLDKLGIKQFHLISTSAGCNIALLAAEAQPERILSWTVEGGECFTRDQDRRGQTARQIAAEKASDMGHGVFDNDYSIWSGWPPYQWNENKWWQTPSFQTRLMRRRYTKEYPPNAHREEMVAGAKALTSFTTIDMVGDRDEIMKISVAQAWKLNMPQAKVAVVAGGTHDIQNSQPEQFVEIMKACSLDPSPSKLMCPGD